MRAPYWRIASPATGGFTRRVASAPANSTARCNCTSPRRVFGQLQSLLLGELRGLQVSSAVIARDCDTRRPSRAGGLKRTAGLLPVSLENPHSLWRSPGWSVGLFSKTCSHTAVCAFDQFPKRQKKQNSERQVFFFESCHFHKFPKMISLRTWVQWLCGK